MTHIGYHSLHHRHLLVACESVLLIMEIHTSELLRYKAGNIVRDTISGASWAVGGTKLLHNYIGGWASVRYQEFNGLTFYNHKHCKSYKTESSQGGNGTMLSPSGRLRSLPEECTQYRRCYDTLEEISEFVEGLILSTERSAVEEEKEEEEREVLQQMKTVRDSVSKIFRKLELE